MSGKILNKEDLLKECPLKSEEQVDKEIKESRDQFIRELELAIIDQALHPLYEDATK